MEYVIKRYDTTTGGECLVEYELHYEFLWFWLRVTPVRQKHITGGAGVTEPITGAKRMWISTSGAGFFRLEQA